MSLEIVIIQLKGYERLYMITINAFLDGVLDDFQNYVHSGNPLCKLHDSHFDGGNIPDYSDKNIQQLYLLRYAYVYAFEYKYMYSDLFRRIRVQDDLSVTSIGCGSMLDYWALCRVLRDDCCIYYRGVDTIRWYYRFPFRRIDNGEYDKDDAVRFFREDTQPSDVYIFPKSISEFTFGELNQIVESFNIIAREKDRVCFLFSLRKDVGSLERDLQKTSVLYRGMVANGFHSEERAGTWYCFSDDIQGEKIRSVDSDFCHPGNVVDCLKELYSNCPSFGTCDDAGGCRTRLGRWPILKCGYVAYQIFTFEK